LFPLVAGLHPALLLVPLRGYQTLGVLLRIIIIIFNFYNAGIIAMKLIIATYPMDLGMLIL
jgi:hypothetical protein